MVANRRCEVLPEARLAKQNRKVLLCSVASRLLAVCVLSIGEIFRTRKDWDETWWVRHSPQPLFVHSLFANSPLFTPFAPQILHKLLLWNALGNMQAFQEHFTTIVYAKFGGQTEWIMGNWRIWEDRPSASVFTDKHSRSPFLHPP